MPDLQPPQSVQPSAPAAGASPPVRSPGVDPLTGLRKMSTTAGLGTGDYVAISPLAIVALLAGLASILVLILNGNLLLLIPAAGVVCALVAFRQIRHSNGTLTGLGIAAAGLVLSLLIGGGVVASRVVTDIRYKPDRNQIADLIRQLGRDVAAAGDAARSAPPATGPTTAPATHPVGTAAAAVSRSPAEIEAGRQYDAAYKLFSDKFRARVDEQKFKEIWTEINKSGETAITGMDWNEQVEFDTETGTGSPVAYAMALLKFKKSTDEPRETVVLTKITGSWQIDDIPAIFPAEKTPRSSQKAPGK